MSYGTNHVLKNVNLSIMHREFLGSTVRYGVRFGTSELSVDRSFESAAGLRTVGDPVSIVLASDRLLFLAP